MIWTMVYIKVLQQNFSFKWRHRGTGMINVVELYKISETSIFRLRWSLISCFFLIHKNWSQKPDLTHTILNLIWKSRPLFAKITEMQNSLSFDNLIERCFFLYSSHLIKAVGHFERITKISLYNIYGIVALIKNQIK